MEAMFLMDGSATGILLYADVVLLLSWLFVSFCLAARTSLWCSCIMRRWSRRKRSVSFPGRGSVSDKSLYIISGCNGAGKTTASYTVLPEILDCKEFL
jgi:hypothetical protein